MDKQHLLDHKKELQEAADFKVHTSRAYMIALLDLALKGLDEWQSIDTAPKDGTFVLLTDSRVTDWTLVAAWSDGSSLDRGWQTQDGLGYLTETFTHWKPLPTPPKEGGVK